MMPLYFLCNVRMYMFTILSLLSLPVRTFGLKLMESLEVKNRKIKL